jgi:hypothetical protein
MTDFDLQSAIAELSRPPAQPDSAVVLRRRAALLNEVLGAIQARGGSFIWKGVAYLEYPDGQLGQRLPWG